MLFVKKVISFYYSPDVCTLLFSPKLFLMAETKHEKTLFTKRIESSASNFPAYASCLIHYPQKGIALAFSGSDILLNKVMFLLIMFFFYTSMNCIVIF